MLRWEDGRIIMDDRNPEPAFCGRDTPLEQGDNWADE